MKALTAAIALLVLVGSACTQTPSTASTPGSWVSAPSWSGSSPARSSPRPCSRASGRAVTAFAVLLFLAMGAYTAFLDLAPGLANPAPGPVAGGAGSGAVFLASAPVVACSAAVAARLLSAPTVTGQKPSAGAT